MNARTTRTKGKAPAVGGNGCGDYSSSDSAASSPAPRAKMQKRIPAEIWESKRPIIARLYQEEQRSLREVMQIMEREHGFSATVKMYKSRIWRWGLDKKLKSDEVLAILILKRDRDAQNKRSEFTIRGNKVDYDNIKRYVKRNPSLKAKLQNGQTPNFQTSQEVSCRTPSPKLIPTVGLPPPPELQSYEQMLTMLRNYVDGTFASGRWACEYDVDCYGQADDEASDESFERIIASFALVNQCLKRGDVVSINSVLGPAFESFKQIVAHESPDSLARMICLMWYLNGHRKGDLLRLVMNYLANLAPIILGANHMISQMWSRMASITSIDVHELSMRVYAFLVPDIERRCGSANYLTHLLYSDYVDCIHAKQGPESCEPILRGHMARVHATGKSHPWCGETAVTYAGVLASCRENQGDLQGAANVLTNHLNTYSMTEEQQANLYVELGVKYHRMGKVDAAVSSSMTACKMLLGCNADERLTNTALGNLESVLDITGDLVKAEQVRQYRLDRVVAFANHGVPPSPSFNSPEEDPRGLGGWGAADWSPVSLPTAPRVAPEWLWQTQTQQQQQHDMVSAAGWHATTTTAAAAAAPWIEQQTQFYEYPTSSKGHIIPAPVATAMSLEPQGWDDPYARAQTSSPYIVDTGFSTSEPQAYSVQAYQNPEYFMAVDPNMYEYPMR